MVRQETLTTMDEHATQIKSEDDVKTAAQKIFENVARHDDSKPALEKWIVNAFRERRALALTLDNTKAVVNKFNRMLSGLASNIVVFIWLIVLKIATIKIVILLVSQIVLFAFVFGNTLKITFEAIIFLFFMHPYDVGDRCEIDQIEMVVEEINIFTTVFVGSDKRKIILPNNILATKAIHNFRRSPFLPR
ncbi:mechanosensitive ion channel protein [Trifolium repens]|nr:mechanosensitive ion channel protein [Trifolium repens]